MDRGGDRQSANLPTGSLNARALFVSSTGAIRPPWRLAIFVVLLVVSAVASDRWVGPFFAWFFRMLGLHGVDDTVGSWVELTAVLIATATAVLAIDKRSWKYVWFGSD